MVKKIAKVNKSYKYEGYLMVVTEEGRQFKRRFRESTKGRFSGKVIFNMWDNIYSFKHFENWQEVKAEDIEYEGRYEEIYGKKSVSTKVKEEVEQKVQNEKAKEAVEEKVVVEDGPVKHKEYDTIKSCIEMNIPLYLAGPAGSGKNFTLEQIAGELDMDFYFSNSVQQEFKLTGFIDAGGNYHETEFYKACTSEKPCIFFLDEMDASIPEVLVLLNAAIANGYFEFPTGKVNFGDKVHFVAAGNTVGNGADEQYTGRLTLDQATLDRFAIIPFDYDRKIELSLCKGNVDLVEFIRQLRKEAEDKGIRATFSYRCITMVAKLEGKMPLEKIFQITVMKGFDKDTINTFRPFGSTKYHRALETLKAIA